MSGLAVHELWSAPTAPSSMARGFLTAAELSLNLSSFDAFPLQCHSDSLPFFYHNKMCNCVLSLLLPKPFLSLFELCPFFFFSRQPWGTSAGDSCGLRRHLPVSNKALILLPSLEGRRHIQRTISSSPHPKQIKETVLGGMKSCLAGYL